VFARWEGT
jgi:hypothetical protein